MKIYGVIIEIIISYTHGATSKLVHCPSLCARVPHFLVDLLPVALFLPPVAFWEADFLPPFLLVLDGPLDWVVDEADA